MARGENIVRFAQAPPIKAASAVYVTLAAQVVSLGALVLFERVRGRELATQLAAFGGRPRGADAQALVGAVTVFAVLLMLTTAATVAAAAAYVTWLVRARQANDPSAPSTAVAGAWLIPGVNLVGPALLVHELWKGTRPPSDRRARWLALVAAWWLSWLTTLTLAVTGLARDPSGGLTGAGLAELTCLTLSALLCAATVREVTRLQQLACTAPDTTDQPLSPLLGTAPIGRTT
jgi:hypothetical protein